MHNFTTPNCLEHAYTELTRLGELRELARISDDEYYEASDMLNGYIYRAESGEECGCNGISDANGCDVCTETLAGIYDEVPF